MSSRRTLPESLAPFKLGGRAYAQASIVMVIRITRVITVVGISVIIAIRAVRMIVIGVVIEVEAVAAILMVMEAIPGWKLPGLALQRSFA